MRNGGNLPEGYDSAKAKSFGMKMISSMVTQLGGKLEVSSNDRETEFAVSFRPDKPQPPTYRSSGGADATGSEGSTRGA